MIDTGALKHRVTLQRFSPVKTNGQVKGSYTPDGTFWAFVSPKSVSESPDEKGTIGLLTHSVQMRWMPELPKLQDRLLFKSKVLEISSVVNVDEANVELMLDCTEVVE